MGIAPRSALQLNKNFSLNDLSLLPEVSLALLSTTHLFIQLCKLRYEPLRYVRRRHRLRIV